MTADNLPELSFVHPLAGFPGMRRFVLVRLEGDEGAAEEAAEPVAEVAEVPETAEAGPDAEDGDGPVLYELRSVDKPDLRFLVGVPRAFFPDYTIELDDQSCDDLDLHEPARRPRARDPQRRGGRGHHDRQPARAGRDQREHPLRRAGDPLRVRLAGPRPHRLRPLRPVGSPARLPAGGMSVGHLGISAAAARRRSAIIRFTR